MVAGADAGGRLGRVTVQQAEPRIDQPLGRGAGEVVAGPIFEPNMINWSGGHVSVAPQHVAGIFASNKKITLPEDGAHLLHIAPTTLQLLGIEAPASSDKQALEISD